MYLSRIIDERKSGAGRRRVLIEKPIEEKQYTVKAIFKCSNEAQARKMLEFLIDFRGPAAYTLTAPAPKRGRTKKTEDDDAEDEHRGHSRI